MSTKSAFQVSCNHDELYKLISTNAVEEFQKDVPALSWEMIQKSTSEPCIMFRTNQDNKKDFSINFSWSMVNKDLTPEKSIAMSMKYDKKTIIAMLIKKTLEENKISRAANLSTPVHNFKNMAPDHGIRIQRLDTLNVFSFDFSLEYEDSSDHK